MGTVEAIGISVGALGNAAGALGDPLEDGAGVPPSLEDGTCRVKQPR